MVYDTLKKGCTMKIILSPVNYNVECRSRGVGTGPADPAAAGPMFEPILMIQLKALYLQFS
jgi:hypothetical protein